jgi:hypothetical protein
MNDVIHFLETLDNNQSAGIQVKGLHLLMRALLFADDVILMAPTVPGLISSIRNFGHWCKLNELRVGLSKCAAMGISGTQDLEEAHLLLRTAQPLLTIGHDADNQPLTVPVLDEYKYLGPTSTTLSLVNSSCSSKPTLKHALPYLALPPCSEISASQLNSER